MKRTIPALLAVLAAAFSVSQPLLAQRGGRGGVAPLNPAQSAAASRFEVATELTDAVSAASSALVRASLTLPSNASDLAARARALGTAELNLANARADAFGDVQNSLTRSAPDQAAALLGRGGAAPAAQDDYAGFTSIFDGRTLNGWDGDPMFWRVENGMIIAESTPEKVVTDNTFLIWRGDMLRDFELKLEARFPAASGNSGIQVRARPLTAATGRSGNLPRPWGIGGYQIDLLPNGGDGSVIWFGEAGGGRMSGHAVTRRLPDGQKQIASLGNDVNDAINPPGEWNSYHIIVKGNVMLAHVNGRLASVLIDENMNPAQGYATEGLLAFQMHVGAPFRLEFRNVYVKDLTNLPAPSPAVELQ